MSNNTQDDFKKILMAGISAIGGQADKSSDFIDHILQNVQIPDQFKSTIEDLASKGEGVLKGFGLTDMVGNFMGGTKQGEAAQSADQPAQKAGDDVHGMIMGALDQLDHGQLTQVLGKAAGLISALTGEKK